MSKIVTVVVLMQVDDNEDAEVIAQTVENTLDVSVYDWNLLEAYADGEHVIGTEDE